MAARHRNHTTLGPAERAVYALVERGGIDAAHAALYRRPLLALARAGLIERTPEGHYVRSGPAEAPPAAAAPAGTSSLHYTPTMAEAVRTPPPAAPPAAPPMATLVVRVPQEILDVLDARGPTRSVAAREALERGLRASGMRRKAAAGE